MADIQKMAQGLATPISEGSAEDVKHQLGYTSPDLHRIVVNPGDSLYITNSGRLVLSRDEGTEADPVVGEVDIKFLVAGNDSYMCLDTSIDYQELEIP